METKKAKFGWQDPEEQIKVISFDPPKDDFYKARINTLERENLSLRQKIEELESCRNSRACN